MSTSKTIQLALGIISISLLVYGLLSKAGVFEDRSEVAVLDSEVMATVLSVIDDAQKSKLMKGSILDYQGYIVAYSFKVGDTDFTKTEVLRITNDSGISDLIEQWQQRTVTSVKVRYNSEDPRRSIIDLTPPLASVVLR